MAVFGVTDFANLPSTTVSSGGTDAPAPGTTETFTVASSAGWPGASSSASPPTGFSFADTELPGEVMRCVNRSGTTWTVTRGSEGTTPVSHQAGFTIVQVTSAGDLTALARVDWLNAVTQFGADPTGTNDSTSAINTALTDAAPGQPVYLPTGIYKTTAPILVPPGGVLLGDYANEVATYLDALYGTVIQPASTWSNGAANWNGIISVLGQSDGSYATVSEEQKLIGIMLDCHLLTTGTADGVQLYGGVGRVRIEDFLVAHAPNNGFNPVADGGGNGPGSYRLKRFNVRYAGNVVATGAGFVIFKTSDISCFDCLAENCSGDGWTVTNLSNGMLVGCRSEHNGSGASGGNGFTYNCTSSGTGSGTAIFSACTTDNNNGHGILIESTNGSGVPVQLVGCRFRRDGYNGGTNTGLFQDWAGICISGYPGTVLISGTSVWPGVEDSGSGFNIPYNGAVFSGNNSSHTYIVLGSSYIQGASVGISDDGSAAAVIYGDDVLSATGTTNTGAGNPAVNWPRQGFATLNGSGTSTATVSCPVVTSTSRIFLSAANTSGASGALRVSGRSAGTSFTVTSSLANDSSGFYWEIKNA